MKNQYKEKPITRPKEPVTIPQTQLPLEKPISPPKEPLTMPSREKPTKIPKQPDNILIKTNGHI